MFLTNRMEIAPEFYRPIHVTTIPKNIPMNGLLSHFNNTLLSVLYYSGGFWFGLFLRVKNTWYDFLCNFVFWSLVHIFCVCFHMFFHCLNDYQSLIYTNILLSSLFSYEDEYWAKSITLLHCNLLSLASYCIEFKLVTISVCLNYCL